MCIRDSINAEYMGIKVWNYNVIEEGKPRLVQERAPDMGELFCCNFYRDSPWVIAVGGSKEGLYVWDLEESTTIAQEFGSSPSKAEEPMEMSTGLDDTSSGVAKRKKKNQLFQKKQCCLLYTSPSPRDLSTSRMPSSA
eukprot:TRINITY_DN45176_c0_g1_i1.p2 TRINITY_DN45176_c0_g1~~TRINITY_DN45176_c0_g1_i1.p2  ORF type:complete len:138 (+),score=28.82 TRINITY_DN45176_c0_g1_i1:93-506(+)